MAPLAVLTLAVAVKALYIGLPLGDALDHAWYPMTPRRAAQSTVANLAPLLLLAAPLWLLRALPRYLAGWVLNLVLTLVVLANALNMRFFGDVLPASSLRNAGQVGAIRSSVVDLLEPIDLVLFLDLLLALVLLPWYARRLARAPGSASNPSGRAFRGTLVLGVLLFLVVPLPLILVDRGDILAKDHVRFGGARKIGLLNYHLFDGVRFLKREVIARQGVGEEERRQAVATLAGWAASEQQPSPAHGAARGRNVIVVMLESFQAFPLGLRVGGQPVTPHLDALAGRSMDFRAFYDQTWDGRTADGEFTTLQSLHPLPTGAVATTFPRNRYRGLPAVLAEHGYHTLSAHAFYGAFWNRSTMHPSLGFQQSYFQDRFGPGEKIGMGLGDMEFLQGSARLLEEQSEPFMAFLVTLSTHHPYDLPARHRRLRVGDVEGTLLGEYLHAAHYVDAALGEFVGRLERSGLLERSVLVVFGDHRAELGPPADLRRLLHGEAARPAGLDPRGWRDEHRLPLLVRLPGDSAAGVYDVTAGHLDIAPTVLDLVGIPPSSMPSLGRNLLGAPRSPLVLRDGGFVQGDTLCVVPGVDAGSARCGDLRTGGALAPSRFPEEFAGARARLDASDTMLRGDLVDAPPAAASDIRRRSR